MSSIAVARPRQHPWAADGRRNTPEVGEQAKGRGAQTPPHTPPVKSVVKPLPAWPIYAYFVGFPLWWVMGTSAFAIAIMCVPLVVLLLRHGQVRAPRALLIWLGFLLCLGASAVMVDSVARYIGYFMRAGTYVGVSALFLYVYNSTIPARKIIYSLVAFWAFIIVGGWLGVLVPNGSFSTPMQMLLPGSIASNDFVHNIVHPSFAEIQQPWGAAQAFARPSAPFPFTNAWGCNYALLLPYVFATFTLTRSGKVKALLVGLLGLSLVPAFATLNRGLFIGVALGLGYAALRLALRGRVRPLLSLVAATGVGVVVAWFAGVFTQISARTSTSSTTEDRMALYKETFRRTVQSPLFGWGAPRPSETLQVSVGTQGHIWNIMFSYGFFALALFAGFFWWTVWRSRAIPTPVAMWVHVSVFVGSCAIVYYGFDGPQMSVLMVGAALLLRAASPPPPPATEAAAAALPTPVRARIGIRS